MFYKIIYVAVGLVQKINLKIDIQKTFLEISRRII